MKLFENIHRQPSKRPANQQASNDVESDSYRDMEYTSHLQARTIITSHYDKSRQISQVARSWGLPHTISCECAVLPRSERNLLVACTAKVGGISLTSSSAFSTSSSTFWTLKSEVFPFTRRLLRCVQKPPPESKAHDLFEECNVSAIMT